MDQKSNKKKFNSAQVTMIVRSANERTVDLCYKLIAEQGCNENIFFTSETPFSAALKKSYEIGISEGRPWTFCVDADVLLRPNSIQLLLNFAKVQEQHIFEVQGLIYDKFYDGPRQAGNHLYRTSLLPKAVKLIPEEGVDIRPEKYVLQEMKKLGYPNEKINHVLGLHDFEQYYEDIYRKSFIHAHKHLNFAQRMVTVWKKKMEMDKDFKVALNAFSEGIRNTEEIFVDKNQSLYIEKFTELNIEEKKPIDDNFDLSTIENEIKDKMDSRYNSLDSVVITQNRFDRYLQGFQKKIKKYGISKTLVLNVGLILFKMGKNLKDYVIKNNE